MEDMHEGGFGTHSSGHTMDKKILRAGYYWSTMEAIAIIIPELAKNSRFMQTNYMCLCFL